MFRKLATPLSLFASRLPRAVPRRNYIVINTTAKTLFSRMLTPIEWRREEFKKFRFKKLEKTYSLKHLDLPEETENHIKNIIEFCQQHKLCLTNTTINVLANALPYKNASGKQHDHVLALQFLSQALEYFKLRKNKFTDEPIKLTQSEFDKIILMIEKDLLEKPIKDTVKIGILYYALRYTYDEREHTGKHIREVMTLLMRDEQALPAIYNWLENMTDDELRKLRITPELINKELDRIEEFSHHHLNHIF